MPRRGGLLLFILRCDTVILRCWARCSERGYQQGHINNGRSPQNCIERGCVSVRPSDAILRDDELICFAYANNIGAIVMAADNTRQRRRNGLRALRICFEFY